MKTARLFVPFITLSVLSISHPVFAEDDWQHWNEVIVEHKISSLFKVTCASEQYMVDDFSRLNHHNYTVGADITPMEELGFRVDYMFEREKADEAWSSEHRLGSSVMCNWMVVGTKLQIRGRFERRDIDGIERWRFRPRVKIQRQIDLRGFELSPFVSNEFFYDFTKDEWNQNRAKIAASKDIFKGFEMTLYYMNQAKRDDGNWHAAHVIGTEFVIKTKELIDCAQGTNDSQTGDKGPSCPSEIDELAP